MPLVANTPASFHSNVELPDYIFNEVEAELHKIEANPSANVPCCDRPAQHSITALMQPTLIALKHTLLLQIHALAD